MAFGIILLMARTPLLCKEGNRFLSNIRPTPRGQHEWVSFSGAGE